MDKCPNCGCDSYSFKDRGTLCYVGIFGGGRLSEDCIDIEHANTVPVYCKCTGCGKRFKIDVARGAATK